MRAKQVIDGVARANYHRGGLRCSRLLQVDASFFEQLKKEIEQLVLDNVPSEVADAKHKTNWTKPFGRATQFSLLNSSGRFDDFGTDFNGTRGGKGFHHGNTYPSLGKLIEALPDATNMRLNGMDPSSGLSPHEESAVSMRRLRPTMLVRFHLPIATTTAAHVYLDGEFFNFEEGNIYFFNNGCVHSAVNRGDSTRYHLVWDAWLTRQTYTAMFDENAATSAPFLTRVDTDHRLVEPVDYKPVEVYETMGPGRRIHQLLGLERFGIAPYQFQNVYNRGAYAAWRLRSPLAARLA